MLLKKLCAKKYNFLIFCVLGIVVFFSCKSVPKSSSSVGGLVSGDFEVPKEEEKTAIKTFDSAEKKNKNYTYFSAISEDIMNDVENGSPSSLRRAVQTLRKQTSDVTEKEKVLIKIVSEIMQMVWTNERVDWENIEVSSENSYIGAINSAKKGLYDTSTGNVDFLTIVLPSLVVTKVSDVSSFFNDSENALKKGLQMQPDSVLAFYLLGLLYYKNGMYENAYEQFGTALKKVPEIFLVQYSYALNLFLAGKIQESQKEVEQLLVKYPSDSKVLSLASKIFFQKKDYSKAEEYISRVLQQSPNDLESLLFRAKILIQKEDYIHAASLLDVYSRQDSSSKEYLLLRSRIQFEWSKNNNAAVSTIENALKRYPDDKEILLYAAKICSSSSVLVLGKSAEYYANQVLIEDSENEDALYYATEGLIQNKEWQKAYDISSKLILKPEKRKECLLHHVKICLALKKYDEAWNLVSSFYKEFPSDENVIQAYISVMVSSGKKTQALNIIEQKLKEGVNSKLKSFLYYERSFLHESENDVLSDLRSSLISNPRNSDSLFRLYEIYYGQNDYRKAQYYLKQVVALNPNDAELRTLNERINSLIK